MFSTFWSKFLLFIFVAQDWLLLMWSFAEYQRWTAFGSSEINPLVNFQSGISVTWLLNNRALYTNMAAVTSGENHPLSFYRHLRNSGGFNGIRTHDLCDASAMLVQCWCNAGAMLVQCWCNALPTELWSHSGGSRSICWAVKAVAFWETLCDVDCVYSQTREEQVDTSWRLLKSAFIL